MEELAEEMGREVSTGLLEFFANVRNEARDFAVESWLERFPGFVDGWEPHLRHYAASLRAIERDFAVDEPGDDPVGQRAILGALLMQFRTDRSAGQITEATYEWVHRRARLALSELDSSSQAELDAAVGEGVAGLRDAALSLLPAASPESEASPTSTLAGPSRQPSAVAAVTAAPARPQPKIVLPAKGGGGHRAKRARTASLPNVCSLFILAAAVDRRSVLVAANAIRGASRAPIPGSAKAASALTT